MFCSKCGCRVEPGMKKCPVCGSILDNEYTRYEKKMKKKRIQKKALYSNVLIYTNVNF